MVKLVVLTTCFVLSGTLALAVDIGELAAQKDGASKALFVSLDEYTKACAEYETKVDERLKAEEELASINERVKVLKSDLSVRATSMYRRGPFQILDLLMGSTSFAEFTTTWDLLRMINEQQAANIEEMRELKKQQDDLIALCASNESEAAKIMRGIEEQTASLNDQIAQLDSSIKKAESEKNAAELAQAEQSRRIAQEVMDNTPTPSYPIPSYLGDGAWDATISSLLTKYGVADSWLPVIRNIIWRESTNNPNAVGGGGAYVGLCQFNAYWTAPRGWSGTGDWRYDPVASIERMVQLIVDTGSLGNHWAATNY
jgi:hypothetical protein